MALISLLTQKKFVITRCAWFDKNENFIFCKGVKIGLLNQFFEGIKDAMEQTVVPK